MFNSVNLHGHAFYDGKSTTDSCSSSSEESSSESLFDRLWQKTVIKIIEQQSAADFSKVINRFGSSSIGTRCIKETHVGGESNQVHANRVKLGGNFPEVICSQAPTFESEGEFWKLVVENSHLIVDLTNPVDKSKKGVHSYYPDGEPVHFTQGARIDLNERALPPGLFSYTVHTPHQQPHSIERLHFDRWPDFGSISVDEFQTLLTQIETKRDEQPDQPVWIHCRAGVGRTGTVAVGLALKQLHREGKLSQENARKELNKLIMQGRRQRDVYFVQSKDQYKLLLNYIDKLFC